MEDEKKQNTVSVGENDEIVEIIDKIKAVSGKSVTLAIPDEALILQDVTNLKILQKKAEEMGKEISISRSPVLAGAAPRPSLSNLPADLQIPQQHAFHARSAARGMDGIRPMSDMVKKNETVDLRNLSREKASETEQPDVTAPREPYSREKYFSEEALPARKNEEEKSLLSEAETLPADDSKQEEGYSLADTLSQGEQDEAYWEKLAEKKMAERGAEAEEAEKFEGVFDEHGRSDGEYDAKSFDFSYPDASASQPKKKFSVLPTISSRFFAVFILVCILTASLALFFILPKADIAVALKGEKVKGDFNLVLDSKLASVDADAGKVPVKTTEIKSEQTQTFASGSKKRVTVKASGNIVIYNECSTGPQTLVAGTRFLSKDGKIFKTEETANVSGFTKPEDEIVAGTETVKVVAEEAGESYNIAATTFTIPKLQEQGSWKYSCLYAKSEQAMAGGLDKEVLYVSQEDYDKAKAALLPLVQKENDDKVSTQADGDAIYLSDKTDTGTVEEKSSVDIGAVADSFSLTLAVKKSVLSVSKRDMEDVLGKKILAANTFSNAKPVAGSLDYTVGDLMNKDSQLSIDVAASETFAFELDQDKTKREIAGKNKQELNDYFAKMSGINSVSVNFWPFWVTRVPESVDKINITVSSGV